MTDAQTPVETTEFRGTPTSKTYKREMAGFLIATCIGFYVFGVYTDDQNALDAAKEMLWPFVGFAAGAFGFEAVRKQF